MLVTSDSRFPPHDSSSALVYLVLHVSGPGQFSQVPMEIFLVVQVIFHSIESKAFVIIVFMKKQWGQNQLLKKKKKKSDGDMSPVSPV